MTTGKEIRSHSRAPKAEPLSGVMRKPFLVTQTKIQHAPERKFTGPLHRESLALENDGSGTQQCA